MKFFGITFLLLLISENAFGILQNVNVTETIDSLLNNYDKRLRPNFGGVPVDVKVSMYVIAINALSDIDMDYTLDFYFRQYWNDPRLSFDKTSDLEVLSFGQDFGKSIWMPDLFFIQDRKESFQHTITTKNEFVKVDYHGNVTRSIRLSVSASCPMNFRSYPMDLQSCSLDIESYGQNLKGMNLKWNEEGLSVGISDDLSLDLFEFVGHTETTELIQMSHGNYSRLSVSFSFKRMPGYYIRQVYIPCTMIVILSWITFWLNRRAFNVRLMICALSLLILTIGLNIVGLEIPKTSYTKAIDVFTGVCMTFTFIALVVFAYLSNTAADSEKDFPLKVDKFFRIAFPVVFVIFNVLYWTIY